jgi:hypothetical protein
MSRHDLTASDIKRLDAIPSMPWREVSINLGIIFSLILLAGLFH